MPPPGNTGVPALVNHTVVDVTISVRGPYDVLVSTREMYGSKLVMPWPLVSKVEVPFALLHIAPGGQGGGALSLRRASSAW